MLEFSCYYPDCVAPLTPEDLRCPACGRPVFMLHERYQVLRDLGRGGFGLVYEAFDRQEQRRCAIKTIEQRALDDAQVRKEVDLLVEQAGKLPFIPTVYEDWREGNRHYIAMEYISGKTLDQIASGPWQPAEVEYFLRVMLDNLAQMHDSEIVHRDIKPVNIKRTDEGRYVLLDFGIAKRGLDTSSIKAMTLDYAPAEQMQRDRRTDLRSDLYSLGVTAYQLLTSKLPATALDRQAGKQLVPPSQLAPATPPQLERVLEHMLKLEPDARPDDARAALAELDAPVQPSEATERMTVSVPDQPSAALARFGSGRLYDVVWAPGEAQRLFAAASIGLYSYDSATLAEQVYARAEQPLRWLAIMPGNASVLAISDTQARLYRAADGSALKTLCSFPSPLVAAAPSPDLQRLVVAAEEFVQIWRLSGATAALVCQHSIGERCRALVFAPTGAVVAGAFGSEVVLWSADDGRVVQRLRGAQGRVSQLVFTPDGDFVATLTHTAVQLWRTADGQLLHTVQDSSSRCVSVAFAANTLLITWERVIQLRGILDGELLEVVAQLPAPALCAALAPDASMLAVVSAGDVQIIRLAEAGASGKTIKLAGPVNRLCFSPDAKLLAGWSEASLCVWRMADARQIAATAAHSGPLQAVAWVPGQQQAIVLGGPAHIVEYANGMLAPVQNLPMHAEKQAGIAVAPDGSAVASASSAGAHICTLATGQVLSAIPAVPAQSHAVAWSADAQHVSIIATACETYLPGGQAPARTIPYPPDTYDMALSANGELFAVLTETAIELHRIATGDLLASLEFAQLAIDDSSAVQGISLSPDGSLLAIVGESQVGFWDIVAGVYRCEISASAQRVVIAADNSLAALLHNNTAEIWALDAQPQARPQLYGHTDTITDAAWSPDASLLLTSSRDGTARLWHVG